MKVRITSLKKDVIRGLLFGAFIVLGVKTFNMTVRCANQCRGDRPVALQNSHDYFTAISPLKLYQRKNSSTWRKPAAVSNSWFSSGR